MNVIFSKKGMDSAYGKVVNPILPDETMLALPIPRPCEKYSYEESIFQPLGKPLNKIIEELTENKFNFKEYRVRKGRIISYKGRCHRDPDIYSQYYKNADEWQPALGYTDKARLRLDEIVKEEDIFIFYGTFKRTYYDKKDNKLKYVERSEEFQAMYGYLKVKEIINLKNDPDKRSFNYKNHPHTIDYYQENNTKNFLFASDTSNCGIFKFTEKLILTAPYRTKTVWNLPSFFSDAGVEITPTPVSNMKIK